MVEDIKNELKKAEQQSRELTRKVKAQTIGYILAAFGLVAGLAWNQAIKSLIDYVFPLSQNSILAQFLYAGAVTVVLVWATIILLKFSDKQ